MQACLFISSKVFRFPLTFLCAQLAQLVEQRTENPRVSGSIPELGIFLKMREFAYRVSSFSEDGALAQVVEHLTFNQVVRGSNPRCFMNGPFGIPKGFLIILIYCSQ